MSKLIEKRRQPSKAFGSERARAGQSGNAGQPHLSSLKGLMEDETGVAMIEYALLCALLALALISSVGRVGSELANALSAVSAGFESAAAPSNNSGNGNGNGGNGNGNGGGGGKGNGNGGGNGNGKGGGGNGGGKGKP